MNYERVKRMEKSNQRFKEKVRTEKDYKKREELGLKIKINEFKIKLERLKK
jgi:hypothetical protein